MLIEAASREATGELRLAVEKFGEGFVVGPLGNCPVSYLRFVNGRVLVPVKEQQRRDDAARADEIYARLLAEHVNPDTPFRYEPPEQPVVKARLPGTTYRFKSVATRRSYRRWSEL